MIEETVSCVPPKCYIDGLMRRLFGNESKHERQLDNGPNGILLSQSYYYFIRSIKICPYQDTRRK